MCHNERDNKNEHCIFAGEKELVFARTINDFPLLEITCDNRARGVVVGGRQISNKECVCMCVCLSGGRGMNQVTVVKII